MNGRRSFSKDKKMTIFVGEALRKRMLRYKGRINWSAVAQEAFNHELNVRGISKTNEDLVATAKLCLDRLALRLERGAR